MPHLIQKVKISQIIAGEIGITWEVNDASQAFEFFVDRSGSSEGPFTQVNSISIRNSYGYIDRSYNDESVNRQVYYRIRGINLKEEIISETVSLDQNSGNYLGFSIVRGKRLLLERFVGTKCFVFIRKTFGKKCSNCYDEIRQKSISSYCPVCYGTTYEGGYFSPILMYIQLNPLVKANTKSDLQNVENLRIDGIWTINYPILSPLDLIVEAEHQDQRYIIENPVSHTEQHNVYIEQRFPVTQVQLSRIEMKVPVPKNIFSINDVNVYRQDF